VAHGYNFAEQWSRALQLDPPFVMVTGWNEWIAGRFRRPGEPLVFVDQFTQEFSRDIEPMKGGHGDNYYLQLIANIRRYKGSAALPKSSGPKMIDLQASFEQWRDVMPDYRDLSNDTSPRDYAGAAGLHYSDASGRNDLIHLKVAHDETNLYFYAQTRERLTAPTDRNWMWLFIDADQDARTGWNGFDFIVNRSIDPDGVSWLEKCDGGWKWKKIAPVTIKMQGNELHLAIPRAALGLAHGKPNLDFKWADNLQHPGNVMDFYLSGDVAPEGRFAFRYSAEVTIDRKPAQ
jgi:hypothetical protein